MGVLGESGMRSPSKGSSGRKQGGQAPLAPWLVCGAEDRVSGVPEPPGLAQWFLQSPDGLSAPLWDAPAAPALWSRVSALHVPKPLIHTVSTKFGSS